MNQNAASQISRPSPWRWGAWICGFSSLLLFVIFVAEAFHIRLGLGYWPKPMIENYETIPFRIHVWATMIAFYFSVFAVAIWLLCFAAKATRPPWTGPVVIQISAYLLGWLLIIGFFKFDPTTFTEWWLD